MQKKSPKPQQPRSPKPDVTDEKLATPPKPIPPEVLHEIEMSIWRSING